jgi:hypothetical protein
MALSFRRSILNRSLLLISCSLIVCVLSPNALAQHPGNRMPVGGGVHVSPPPMYHAPISNAPIYRPPVSNAPIYRAPITSPRMATVPVGPVGEFRAPSRPIRPWPPIFRIYAPTFLIFGNPFWGSNFCWWATCGPYWTYGFIYNPLPSYDYGPAVYSPQVYETPVYIYGDEGSQIPQLFLKDGSMINVTDYWVVDDQLHFTIVQQEGGQPAEQVVPFDELDLQKTVDSNSRRGFRFVLRNEPVEQYLRDHPDGTPPPLVHPPQQP